MTKGPLALAITEYWNYKDTGKDFFSGYAYLSHGPCPWAGEVCRTGAACGATR